MRDANYFWSLCSYLMNYLDLPEELRWRKEPKQERSKRLVEKVLDTALHLVAKKGLSSFNTNALADLAGVDVASIYQYLPNKEAILFWSAERWYRQVRAVCVEMDSRKYADMDWRSFFALYGEKINAVPEFHEAFISLQSLWLHHTRYQILESKHEEFMVGFLAKHLARFGASCDAKLLKSLSKYLYITSNSVITASQIEPEPVEAERLLGWNYNAWMLLLESIISD